MKKIIKMKDFTPLRDVEIVKLSENQNVLHIGACDWPFTEKKFESHSLLFQKIDNVCKEQVGIDLDKDSVNFLNQKSFKKSSIIYGDMDKDLDIDFKPEIIVFGETLEHLANPGIALDSLKKLMDANTSLIISVPNAVYVRNFISALFGAEWQHEDHKLAFTYKTLKQLLEWKGLHVKEIKYTFLSPKTNALNWKGKFFFYFSRPLARIFPMLASNILVVCELSPFQEGEER